MRNKVGKKLLSLFLAFVMLLSSLSVGLTAFAAPNGWGVSVKYGPPTSNDAFDYTTVTDVTSYLETIANALYGDYDTTRRYSSIAPVNGQLGATVYNNETTHPYSSLYGGSWRGVVLEDDEYAHLNAAINAAWYIIMVVGQAPGKTKRLDQGKVGGTGSDKDNEKDGYF